MSPQIPLALRFAPDQRFDAYHGQAEIVALVRQLARGERNDWIYLAGPSGSGKSHLLLAACAERRDSGGSTLYLPLAAVAGRLADALHAREATELVCLDGLEAIAGHREDEVALFHFHNAARDAGARLVYAARELPAALPFVLPDLVSRLGQCTRLSLESLDDDARKQVLRERAFRRGLELDESVLEYLLRRVGRDLGSLTALLDRLDRESLAAQRRITVPFLKSVLERGD